MSLGFSRPALKLLDFKLLSNKRTKLLASTRLLPTTYLTSTAPASVAVDSTIPMGPWNLPPSCRWLTQEPGQRTTPERAFHSLRSSQPVVTSNPPEATDPVVYGPWHLPPSCRYLLQPPTKGAGKAEPPSARCEQADGYLISGRCPHSIKVSSRVQQLTGGVPRKS